MFQFALGSTSFLDGKDKLYWNRIDRADLNDPTDYQSVVAEWLPNWNNGGLRLVVDEALFNSRDDFSSPTGLSETKPSDVSRGILTFLHDRLKIFLRDRGVRHDVIDASIAMSGADDLALLTKRAEALQAFLGTAEGEDLIQGFRRADNILAQAEAADGVEYSYGPDRALARTDEERALFDALDAAEPRIDAAMAEEDFSAAMGHMAALRGPVDAFFEAVQVNDPHAATRRNRLNLLHRIRAACLKVADLRRLEG